MTGSTPTYAKILAGGPLFLWRGLVRMTSPIWQGWPAILLVWAVSGLTSAICWAFGLPIREGALEITTLCSLFAALGYSMGWSDAKEDST